MTGQGIVAHTPMIQATRRLKQEDHHESEANLGYIIKLCLKKKGGGRRKEGGRERRKKEGREGGGRSSRCKSKD